MPRDYKTHIETGWARRTPVGTPIPMARTRRAASAVRAILRWHRIRLTPAGAVLFMIARALPRRRERFHVR